MAEEGVNSAGSVSVDVVPNGKTFGPQLKAIVVPAGTQAGKDLSDALTKTLAASIIESVTGGIRDAGKAAVPLAAKAGDESGSAFADAFRARVDAGLSSLPNAKIGADTSEVDEKLAEIRAAVEEIAAESPSIRVQVDDLDAEEKLAEITALVRAVGSESANINIGGDASGEIDRIGESALSSAPSLGILASTIVTLAPLAVPAAAAAAAAIAGIGVAGIGAASGVGVVALALSRVIGTIKDMGAAQKSQNDTVSTGTSNAFAYANAVDGLKSAQASYANTVANAADAQRQAAESVANAELGLADAQRSELQAQVALTAAKKAAVDEQNNLNNSIADGAISQQQAALDLTTAEAKLAALEQQQGRTPTAANPAPTNAQLEQAQIDVESAQQRITDLATTQGQLTAQYKQSQIAGINGATGVVSAQQGVVSATEQVAKAEQSLADARAAQATQARQSAFAIAQAQQGIVQAERSLQQASDSAGASASKTSAATTKLQQDLAALTPAGRAFATYVFGLKGDLTGLQDLAEKGLLPGAEDLLKSLVGTYLPGVRSLVAGVSDEVGKLEISAGHTFTDPFWHQFFGFLSADAVPALKGLYAVGVNVATGLAGIVEAGEPLGRDFGGGLLSFSEKFAADARDLKDNPAFQQVLAYIEQEAPQVAKTLEEVVVAVGHLSAALAPIGNVEVKAIGELADVIDEIPTPVLTAIAAAFIVINLALKGYNAYVAVSNTLGKVFNAILGDTATKATAAGAAAEGLAVGETAAADAAVAAETTMGLFTDLLGGPLGIAIGVAGAALAVFSHHAQDNTQDVTELTGVLGQLSAAYRNVGDAGAQSVQQLVAQNTDLQNLIINANQLGISVGTIQQALNGSPQALQQINDAYSQRIAILNQLVNDSGSLTTPQLQALYAQAGVAFSGGIPAAQKLLIALSSQKAAIDGTITAQNTATTAQGLLNDAQGAGAGVSATATARQTALANVVTALGDTSSTASEKITALKDAEDAFAGTSINAKDATEAFDAAYDGLTASIKQNGDSLDITTAKGRANTDALKAAALAAQASFNANIANGDSLSTATDKYNAQITALETHAEKLGLSKKAVDALVAAYGLIPTSVTTAYSTTGSSAVDAELGKLEIQQIALKDGVSLATAEGTYRKTKTALNRAFAEGGPIGGVGGPTEDANLIWASKGEYMQPSHAVDYYGEGMMDAIRAHAIPRDAFRGFAAGGVVDHFAVDLSNTKIPSMAEIRAAITGPIDQESERGLPSAVTRWAAVSAQVLKELHQPAASLGAVLRRIQFESGGDPRAVNDSDVNARNGMPSTGLVQVIRPTFQDNAGQYRNVGPFLNGVSVDPLANVFAGMHYAVARYGSVHAIDPLVRPYGYDSGGYLPPGLTLAYNGTNKPEPVFTAGQGQQLGLGGGGATKDRALVSIETFVAGQNADAHEIAAELDWTARMAGGR